jgi:hypothetical protein
MDFDNDSISEKLLWVSFYNSGSVACRKDVRQLSLMGRSSLET